MGCCVYSILATRSPLHLYLYLELTPTSYTNHYPLYTLLNSGNKTLLDDRKNILSILTRGGFSHIFNCQPFTTIPYPGSPLSSLISSLPPLLFGIITQTLEISLIPNNRDLSILPKVVSCKSPLTLPNPQFKYPLNHLAFFFFSFSISFINFSASASSNNP